MRKILFIFNPCSGKAQLKNKLMDILNLLAKAGGELLVHPTQGPGDAREAVKAYANSVDLVICSGGDGTLSETINGLVALERCPDLGYIPSGSTNDFAASLHLPKDMLAAAVLAVSGVPCPVDVGLFCGDRHFIYIAAFGMFTEVSYSTPQEKKNVLGHQAYMLESVKSLTTIKSYSMKVECEEMLLEGEFIFGMITNTMSVGGFKGLVSQEVALDDGEFEVMFVRTPKTPLDLTGIIQSMFLKEESGGWIHKFRTRSLKIQSEEPVDWVLDGEFGGSHTIAEVTNLKKRIKIMRNL